MNQTVMDIHAECIKKNTLQIVQVLVRVKRFDNLTPIPGSLIIHFNNWQAGLASRIFQHSFDDFPPFDILDLFSLVPCPLPV